MATSSKTSVKTKLIFDGMLTDYDKARRYDEISKVYENLGDNVMATIDAISSIIKRTDTNKNTVEVNEKQSPHSNEFTYPFTRDIVFSQYYTSVFKKKSFPGMSVFFEDIFKHAIENSVYRSGELLPSPKMVSDFLINSTKQTENKIRKAFDFLSTEHRRITNGVIWSKRIINKINYDTYVVL